METLSVDTSVEELEGGEVLSRREFAIQVTSVMMAFLTVYSLAEIAVAASLVHHRDAHTDPSSVPFSLAMNLAMIACLALFRTVNGRTQARTSVASPVYRRSCHALLAVGLPFVLGHMHLAGSQSNPNAFLLLVYVTVSQRLLGSQVAWRYLAATLAGYVALVLLEANGVLPYAPLLANKNLGAEFLYAPYVAVNITTFAMVAIYLLAFLAQSEASYLRARNEIRDLHAILRMCAWCKRILDDHGEWQPVEHYLSGRPTITHGMCPTCREREIERL